MMDMVDKLSPSRRTVLKSAGSGLAGLVGGAALIGSASASSHRKVQIIQTERFVDEISYSDRSDAEQAIKNELEVRLDRPVEYASEVISEQIINDQNRGIWEEDMEEALFDTYGTDDIQDQNTRAWIVLDYLPIDSSTITDISASADGQHIAYDGVVSTNYAFVTNDLVTEHAQDIVDDGTYSDLLDELPDDGGDPYNPYGLPFYVYVQLHNYMVTDIAEIEKDLADAATSITWDNSGPWKTP